VIARLILLLGLVFLAPLTSAQEPKSPPAPAPHTPPPEVAQPEAPAIYRAFVVNSYPHDPAAFTQGLLWHEGWLYESTGRVGTSSVRKVDLETGKAAISRSIPYPQFGEGLALWGNELVSLTWRSGVIHRWQLSDLSPASAYADYPFQGWGLTRMGEHLVASDGTDTLRFLDPRDYSVERSVKVTLNARPLPQLNELEFVNGLVLANIWKTNFIAGIDPASGAVRLLIDCRTLPPYEGADPEAVLNGIAWDEESERLFVTGKLWPRIYEIELRQARAAP
jgi:glutaminyl-peptide cyclotransferase